MSSPKLLTAEQIEQMKSLFGNHEPQKVKVDARALLARVNRALAKSNMKLFKCKKNARAYDTYGDYYQINTLHNSLHNWHVDLEALGRELGVLGPHESLAE